MAFKVYFGGQIEVAHTVTSKHGDAMSIAFAMSQAGYAVGVQNMDTYEITYQAAIKGRKLSPQDYDAGLLPVSKFPRTMHQRQGFPTGDAINISRRALRPGFEREGSLDRPAFAPAGSMASHGYTEVYIG